MKISVLCNPGPHGEEIPCAFHLGGRRLPVLVIMNRWTESQHRYYEVLVHDGRRFVLRHEVASPAWELAAVYAATRPAAKPKARQSAVRRAVAPLAQRWWPFSR